MAQLDQYLRSALISLRQSPRGRYGLFHPGSGALIATDRMGLQAAAELRNGNSLGQVHRRLAATGALSDAGFEAFASALRHVGALGEHPSARWRRLLRGLACRWLGVLGSVGTSLLPALPVWSLRLLLDWLPRAVLAPRIMAQAQWYLNDVLMRSGYERLSVAERRSLLRAVCRAASRTMLFGLLVVLADPGRAQTLLRHIVRARGLNGVRAAAEAGGVVVACLHSDCYLALLALHARTFAHASCVVRSEMVSVGLQTGAAPSDYVAQALGAQISNTAAMGARRLAACIRQGGVVTLPIDAVPVGATRGQVASLAGHPLRANRGPAWLAVRTGRPLFLATTRWEGRRVLVDYGEPLRAPAGLSQHEQVERLTSELHVRADRWLRAYPGAWTGWTFLDHYVAQLPFGQGSNANQASEGKGTAPTSLVRMHE